MSNNPKKVVDPTEAAMAAIQEALKVRDAEMTSSVSARPAPAAPPPAAREELRRPVEHSRTGRPPTGARTTSSSPTMS